MLVSLSPFDIPDVMRIERLPGYEAYIHSWTAEEHLAELASPDSRYFGWRTAAGLMGFAILQKYGQPGHRLRRLAVAEPGGGTGTALLRGVVDGMFRASAAEAVDLHVKPDNLRARHVYGREGFVVGGGDDLQGQGMVLTRAAWAALPRRTGP
jgi:hypothetical protein